MQNNTVSAQAANIHKQLLRGGHTVTENWKHVLDNADPEVAPPISDPWMRYVTAQLLQNAAINEGTLNTNTTADLPTQSQPQLLGMIRQVMPRLVAPEFTSVQPMTGPTGVIYTLDLLRDDSSDIYDHSTWSTSKSYADHTAGEGQTIAKSTRLTLTSQNVALEDPKKLYTENTLELQQDMRATHNLDAAELLRGAAVDEIAIEIDNTLVGRAYAMAAAHHTVTFGQVAPAGWTEAEWRLRLPRAILEASNKIYEDSDRDPNFIIAGPQAAMELVDLNTFRLADGFSGTSNASLGVERIGTIQTGGTSLRVLRSRVVPTNEMLIGRKGDSIVDAGLFFLPYILLYLSDLQVEPRTQRLVRSLMSRFAIHEASNKLFARVVIDAAASGIS